MRGVNLDEELLYYKVHKVRVNLARESKAKAKTQNRVLYKLF